MLNTTMLRLLGLLFFLAIVIPPSCDDTITSTLRPVKQNAWQAQRDETLFD